MWETSRASIAPACSCNASGPLIVSLDLRVSCLLKASLVVKAGFKIVAEPKRTNAFPMILSEGSRPLRTSPTAAELHKMPSCTKGVGFYVSLID